MGLKSQDNKELVKLEDKTPAKYKWKGNKKQRLFIEYWVNPQSDTFGNASKSGVKAGFSNSYSLNLTHLAPKWLSENIEKLNLYDEHIKQGIYDIALNTDSTNSRSPNDTKLKAYEVLSDIHGMTGKGNSVNVNIVQPILGGASAVNRQSVGTTVTPPSNVIDLDSNE